MGRPKNSVPSYLHHKPSDTARTWVGGKYVTLGRYNSPESRTEYARIVAEHAAGCVHPAPSSGGPTVNEVLAYLKFADQHYRRPDGSATHEPTELRYCARPLRLLYGHTPAAEFGPLALKVVRQKMVW